MTTEREPTPAELLEGLGHPAGSHAAWKVTRSEEKLREARSILSGIITAYAQCFDCNLDDSDAPTDSHTRLGEALEAGRQHIMACGFREMPSEAFNV